MLPVPRAVFLLGLALALAGCASLEPRYQTFYRYEPPPIGPQSKACLENCEQKLAGCQQRCAQAYRACVSQIEPLLEQRLADARRHYEAELDRYADALEHYHLSLSMSWGHDAIWYGHPFYYHPWPAPYYLPPLPPKRPEREQIFKQLRDEKCDADCGCQSLHDACFLSCGGRKIPEVRCIANCPPDKPER